MKNVLFITKDSQLLDAFSKKTSDAKISLNKASILEEGEKKLSSQPVDALIIDEDNLDLIKNWINTHKKEGLKVFLIAEKSYESFLKEKANLAIDGLLQKPLKEEFQTLLLFLIQPQQEIPESDLKELIIEYQKTLFDKLFNIQMLIHKFIQSKQKDDRVNLRNAVHKLAGNSGSYGYLDASKLCKEQEKLLESDQELTQEHLDSFLQNLVKSFFNRIEPSQSASISQEAKKPAAQGEELSLYLIDDDEELTKLIQLAAEKKGLKIECENSFTKALEKILQPGFCPKVILFDLISEKEPLSGFDLIEKFLASPTKSVDTIIGIMSAKGEVSTRAKALNFAIDFFIQKPVNPNELLERITKLSKKTDEKRHKVLLVDDDENFCKLLEAGFKNSTIELKTLLNGETLLAELEAFRPELLLLDYFLPNQTGLDLFRIIRSSIKFRSIPIMFITANEDPKLYKEAITLGIQGFFTKPISAEDLLTNLKNFFFKQESVQTLLEKDPTLGIYQKEFMFEMFESSIKQQNTFCVVFIQLNFDTNQVSNADATAFWGDFCAKLNAFTSNKDLIGSWDTHILILIVFDFKKEQLRNLFDYFYSEMFKQEFKNKNFLKLKTVMLSYPKDGKSLDELSTKALAHMKDQPSEKSWEVITEISKDVGDVATLGTKNVLIICSRMELMDILEYTLQLRNITIFKAENGSSAIQWFQQHFLSQPLDLIIIDYDLTGENGIVVLQKVGNFVGERIPILLLSPLNKESDLLEGIEKGIQGYITKPFNIQLLLAKIEQLLY